MAKDLTSQERTRILRSMRTVERAARDFGGVRWPTAMGSPGTATHYVVTTCDTDLAGVVAVKKSTAPGSATAATGAEEIYAWLGEHGFARLGSAVWCMPCDAQVDGTPVPLLILDMIVGAADYDLDTDDLATDQLDATVSSDLCTGGAS